MKICRTCKIEKEIIEFKKNPMYKDGYETQCKKCQKEIKLDRLNHNINSNNIPTKKICRICNEEKDIIEFGKNKAYKDGIETLCKKCRNEKAAVQRDKHREKNNIKYVEKYHSDSEFREHRNEMSRKSNHKMKKEHPERTMLYSSRSRAKEKGWEFNIDESDIFIPTHCPILGIELISGGMGVHAFNSPSIDRIDSSKGYIKGNVQIISLRANMMKNDANLQELEQFCKNILNYMNNEDIVRPIENGKSIELEDKELLG